MRILARVGFVMTAFSVLVFGGHTTFADDFTIDINNNVGSKNQEFVFQYTDIEPGFSADAPIHIINDVNSSATVELIDIQPINQVVSPSNKPANSMLPYVNLTLSRDGVVIATGANGAYQKLINSEVCVPAYQRADLVTHFELPSNVGNEAQNSSLWVRYYFRYTIGDCGVVTPPPNSP